MSLSETVNTQRTLDKRSLKVSFLEQENKDLQQTVEDLQTTLAINKNIIKSLLQNCGNTKSTSESSTEYTIGQLTAENEALEGTVKRVTDERDQAQARLFIMQQIIDNTKDKEEDVAELFRDEIEELKENLERKEYLLQVNEQKYSEYEKLLAHVAEYDDMVRRRLEDINAVPRDRKITNVVLENSNLKQQMEELRYENDRLRD